jgi:SAM-dependent methyltransferase
MGTLRQVVRQELVARQVAAHLPDVPARRVLDVGCGQGTQVVALARHGHLVTGLDASQTLLADLDRSLSAEPAAVRERVRVVHADIGEMVELFGPGCFDVVLCHGVLMYFADPQPVLHAIGQVVAPGGTVCLLVRNADGLALRPALLGDWATARNAFDAPAYLNRIGVQARADRLSELTASLQAEGLTVQAWYGVRVFTDIAPNEAPVPAPDQLDLILECEELAGRTDPYRGVAALTHVIAERAR